MVMSIGSLSLARTQGNGRAANAAALAAGAAARINSTDGVMASRDDRYNEEPGPQKINMLRPGKEVPDVELLQRFQQGDEEGYVELYLRRQAEVYTFCLRLSAGDRDLASDIFQETFIKVYRKAHTFREGTNVLGWLYTIVRTTYLN